MIGGKEIRNYSVLVGAEKERKALEELLHRRAEFTGRPLDGFLMDATSSSNATSTSTSMLDGGKKGRKVVGFGKDSAVTYGLGKLFIVITIMYIYFFHLYHYYHRYSCSFTSLSLF